MKVVRTVLLLTTLLSAGFLRAQQFTGRVTDSTGAVVPKAAVVALNVDTGVQTRTESTKSGDYAIPYLKAGNSQLPSKKRDLKPRYTRVSISRLTKRRPLTSLSVSGVVLRR